MIPTEINLKGHKFQNQYYVSGHFEFEIEVEYEDHSKEVISRRYSEIRSFYKLLLLKCPGCYIPDIPSKSIWLKINYGNQGQMNERMEGIREFLRHIANHKILRKNKYVIYFFSKKFERIDNNSSNSTNNNKISNDEKEDSDDELNFGMNKEDNIDENQDDVDIEPLDDYIQEVNNRNKSIVSKGKQLIGNMYNYLKSYSSTNNNNEEENNINKNNEDNNNFYKNLSKEDYEYIKKKIKELGEDFEINEYNEKIDRLNEGVKNIIQNFEKLFSIQEKNTHALENIVINDKNIKNLEEKYETKNNNIDKFDDNNNNEENNNNKNNNHKNNISKILKYCAIQRDYLDKKVKESLEKIKKHQILLEGLLNIFIRKKDHLNFLGKLHSQKKELEKQKQDNNEDPLIINKIDEFEEKLKYKIKFINKINKDLKYEIEKNKNNQEDIYIFINSLFKEKETIVKDYIKELNEENLEEDKNDKNNENNNNNNIEYNDDKKDNDF